MILYIAEKPSLGRAIADAIPGRHKKADGCIELANGDVVSWCIGHLLEQAEPDAYDPAYKKWSQETLPIIPREWKLIPKPKTRKQLTLLKKWIKKADQLVHAGDPDREGQLLVDEVINYAGVSATKRASVKRCLISDLNTAAVKKSLAALRSNHEFVPLSVSALARSRADWLYGMNMTRAYTLQGKKCGYQGVLSVGRVQTPLLGLVVRRDQEIERFVPHDYYSVVAHLRTENKESFQAKWVPSESCADFLDDAGRNLSRPLAENVAERITNQSATVTRYQAQKKQRAPVLPHSLSSLQIDANKAFGLSAQTVLNSCQSLYEKHKAITYPRSDSRYLPVGHFAQAAAVTSSAMSILRDANVAQMGAVDLTGIDARLNFKQKSKAWNDAKVDAHHAIIPTQVSSSGSPLGKKLTDTEIKVYQLVVRNYLAQFMTAQVYSEVAVNVAILSGNFSTKAKTILEEGWTAIFPKGKNKDDGLQNIPVLQQGQSLTCERGEVISKKTTPPKHFTEATLLAAMTGIARFVRDASLKRILKETDGLGTEATRAGIIELLFKREFLQRRGKTILATAQGKSLIDALPDSASWPDMTAQWESQLDAILHRQTRYEEFMTPLSMNLNDLVNGAQSASMSGLKGLGKAPRRGRKKRRAGGTRSKVKS
ncbi:MAG: DNA topoisomerase III [Cellvibrionaceae bacterium]